MKQMLKKGTVFLLTIAMTLSTTLAGNITAFAVSTDPLTLSKTATPVSGTTDTWEINLSISGSEQTRITTSDIVLVLDTSGSMAWGDQDYSQVSFNDSRLKKVEDSAKTLLDTVLTSQYTRVALVSFSDSSVQKAGFTSYTNINSLKSTIDSLSAGGGTNIQAGINAAEQLLQSSTATNKYIIVLTDGEPTYSYKASSASSYSGWTAIGSNGHNYKLNSFINYTNANIIGSGWDYYLGGYSYDVNGYQVWDNGIGTISEGLLARNAGITVFTIGYNVSNNDRAKYVLRNIAGGSENFYNATTANLQLAFSKIAGKIQSIYPATSGVVTDPIGSQFEFVTGSLNPSAGTTAAYDPSTRKITWNVGTVSDGATITLSYKVKIKSGAVNGTLYPTNGTTTLNYTDSNGNSASKDFVVPKVGINTIDFSYREKENDANVLATDSITAQLGTTYTVPTKTFTDYLYDSTVDANNGVVVYPSATVIVYYNMKNRAPDAVDDTATTNEDTAIDISVLNNDTDPDGDTLTVTGTTNPAHGTVSINPDKTIKYTPNANWNGTDTFTYTISDGNGGTDTATVTVAVSPVNDGPDAVNDAATTNEDTAIDINVLSNDIDIDGDTLTVTGTTNPAHGTVTINPDKTVKYTPNANWNGTDTFTYTISDGHGGTDTATVTVTVRAVNDNPDAVDDTAATNEDTFVNINVLNNDKDADGDTLTVTGVTNPAHGTASINPDYTVKYTPNANWNGTDTFRYTISDGHGGTDTATVTVTVRAVNDKPDAVDDAVSTNEDTAIDINVLNNDTDVDSDTLTVTGTTNPAHGTVAINPDKTIKYTPNANWNGTDTFTYTISDGHGGTDTATVTVTVRSVNDGPNAVNDTATTNEDTAIDINVLSNDIDIDGDTLTVTGTTNPAHGTVSINPDKTVKYTPNANWNGTDTFTYTISDGNGGTDTATVTVTVSPVNDGPNAVNDAVTTNEDTAIDINVLSNDIDIDGDTLTVTGTTNPAHGIVAINSDKTIKYTPNANWNGTDTFTYTISDGHGGTDTATVTVTVKAVNDNPDAIDDAATTNEDVSVNINVLKNDTDIDGDALSITKITQPAHGIVFLNADKTIKYVPFPNWNGIDTFTYTISDGHGGYDTATVKVTVIPVNDAPIALDDLALTNEDAAININVLFNDIDIDGDTLSVISKTDASHGTVSINPDNTIKYTPNLNWYGTDTFKYTVSDGHGGTDTAKVTVIVLPLNDAPIAVNDAAVTDEDVNVKIEVLANDTDADGDTLSVISATEPANGEAEINVDGSITYKPDANWHGTDTFTYTISDGHGEIDTATVTVTVFPVNDPPVAEDDSAETDEDVAIDIDVLANDTDIDGDTLHITNISAPQHGTAVLNADGTIKYTPEADWFGIDTFMYQITDINAPIEDECAEEEQVESTDTATVTIVVKPVNDAPIAADDSAVTDEDTAIDIDVLDNDTDVDGDTLSVISVQSPAHGEAVINADGSITYTPDADWNGTETFDYTISDGNGGEDTATITVEVKAVNDAPIADDSSITTKEDTAANGKVTGSDIDGDELTFKLDKAPEHGKVTLNSNGTYTYTPDADYNGKDSFTFICNDGKLDSQPATVSITITAVDEPIIPQTGEDVPYLLYGFAVLSILAGIVLLIARHKKHD